MVQQQTWLSISTSGRGARSQPYQVEDPLPSETCLRCSEAALRYSKRALSRPAQEPSPALHSFAFLNLITAENSGHAQE